VEDEKEETEEEKEEEEIEDEKKVEDTKKEEKKKEGETTIQLHSDVTKLQEWTVWRLFKVWNAPEENDALASERLAR
jgi:hypothetical protein